MPMNQPKTTKRYGRLCILGPNHVKASVRGPTQKPYPDLWKSSISLGCFQETRVLGFRVPKLFTHRARTADFPQRVLQYLSNRGTKACLELLTNRT